MLHERSSTPTSGSDDELELEAFGHALKDFLRAVHRARGRYAAQTPADELSISQYRLLDGLSDSESPMAVSELALNVGVSAPTATRMLTALERDGLVERERAENGDRRHVYISLTDAGRVQLQDKRAQIVVRNREMFGVLTAAERRQAAQILSRLAAAMEDYQ